MDSAFSESAATMGNHSSTLSNATKKYSHSGQSHFMHLSPEGKEASW